jgi:hypothetical protein
MGQEDRRQKPQSSSQSKKGSKEYTEDSVHRQKPIGTGTIKGGYNIPGYRNLEESEDGLTEKMDSMALTTGRTPQPGVGRDFMVVTPTRHRSPDGSAGDQSQGSHYAQESYQDEAGASSRRRRIKDVPVPRQKRQSGSSRDHTTARPPRSSGREPPRDRSFSRSPSPSSPRDMQLQHTRYSREYPPASSRSPSPLPGNREIKVYAVNRERSPSPRRKARFSHRKETRKSSYRESSPPRSSERQVSRRSDRPGHRSSEHSRPLPSIQDHHASQPMSAAPQYHVPDTFYSSDPRSPRYRPPTTDDFYTARRQPSQPTGSAGYASQGDSAYTGLWVSGSSKSTASCSIRRVTLTYSDISDHLGKNNSLSGSGWALPPLRPPMKTHGTQGADDEFFCENYTVHACSVKYALARFTPDIPSGSRSILQS